MNIPSRGNLDSTGHLLPERQIRANFELAGVLSAENTISYCGSGVTACHNLLMMEQLGMGQGKLFVGGWSQYAHATERPVETVYRRLWGRVCGLFRGFGAQSGPRNKGTKGRADQRSIVGPARARVT